MSNANSTNAFLSFYRLGQKKPVQVFRFITEGTVEEKIIERADRKLFLDAAVIQQGRLAEQNSSMEKGELMKMVRFGADQILNSAGGTYTDEDIDALIARGEEKTSAMQAKLETNAKHNLANFSLLADDDEGTDTFSFGGKNYRDVNKGTGGGNFINLPQRQRKRNYDLSAMENSGVVSKVKGDTGTKAKKKSGPAVYDFQLFDMDRLNEILKKERILSAQKEDEIRQISHLRQQAVDAPVFGSGVAAGRSKEELLQQAERREQGLFSLTLSDEETADKEQIFAEGFPDWSRKDFKAFCAALVCFPVFLGDIFSFCSWPHPRFTDLLSCHRSDSVDTILQVYAMKSSTRPESNDKRFLVTLSHFGRTTSESPNGQRFWKGLNVARRRSFDSDKFATQFRKKLSGISRIRLARSLAPMEETRTSRFPPLPKCSTTRGPR